MGRTTNTHEDADMLIINTETFDRRGDKLPYKLTGNYKAQLARASRMLEARIIATAKIHIIERQHDPKSGTTRERTLTTHIINKY